MRPESPVRIALEGIDGPLAGGRGVALAARPELLAGAAGDGVALPDVERGTVEGVAVLARAADQVRNAIAVQIRVRPGRREVARHLVELPQHTAVAPRDCQGLLAAAADEVCHAVAIQVADDVPAPRPPP